MASEPLPAVPALMRWQWAFHDWATAHVFEAAEAVTKAGRRTPGAIAGGQGDGSLWETLAHMAAAEEHWLNRWLGNPLSRLKSGADYPSRAALRAAWEEASARRQAWLAGVDEQTFAGGVRYFRGTGAENLTPLWQTLLHVANHATHHRAEACAALTAANSPPQGVDMIDWIRAACPGVSRSFMAPATLAPGSPLTPPG